MKTTLDLPDDLMRSIKMRAVREDRKLKDLIAELLRQGLTSLDLQLTEPGHRVKLPLIHSAHAARPDEEMTPDRVAEILLVDEVPRPGAQ